MSLENESILLIEPQQAGQGPVGKTLEEAGFGVIYADTDAAVMRAIHSHPPTCIVMDYGMDSPAADALIREFKGDNIYGHLPIILLIDKNTLASIDWLRCPADDYLIIPFSDTDLLARVRLAIARAMRDIFANPLTGLPGNVTIMREAERRLALLEPFAMAYLDIDHFKAYNDKYGFSRGDEVLRMTARILVNAIKNSGDNTAFAGHVGGDDFVYITAPDRIEDTTRMVCDNFDLLVPNFYDQDDRARGRIDSIDRAGNPQSFPLMSISIAVVDTSISNIGHLADISTRSAEIKKMAKSISGSNYIIDRRR